MSKTVVRRQPSHALALAMMLGMGAAVAVATAEGQQAETAPSYSQLLENAIFTEETLGDLDAAIEIYQELLGRAQAERSYVAQAQFRLGLCYLKQGKLDEAVVALQKLVSDFPNQEQLVSQARARLSELGHPATEAGMLARQVWAGADVDVWGAPSPDGRYLTFVDWTTGDLAVRDLASGEKRRLTEKGEWHESKAYAEYSVVSPDSRQVAYIWFNQELLHELRLIGIDGSTPRVLFRQDDPGHIQPHAWSPDGQHILVLLHRTGGTNRIVLVSVVDGSVRLLKELDQRYPARMSFSPDGRYVVYDLPPSEDSPERDIFLLAVDGDREVPLVQHPANDLFPLWVPDGNRILFVSDRTGDVGIWVLEVSGGEPDGAPELVKRNLGRMIPMGLTGNGSYYYTLFNGVRDMYTATLDPGTGAVLAPPSPVSERFLGRRGSPDWSPDGQYLAYISRRGPVPGIPVFSDELGSSVIMIRSVATGEERELSLQVTTPFSPASLRWAPDGHSLMVMGKDETGRQGLYRVDPESSSVTLVFESQVERDLGNAILSPDGKAVFYASLDPNGLHILVQDLETEEEKELYRGPISPLSLGLSPDGQSLAFAFQDSSRQSDVLMVMPASGGEPRELYEGDGIFSWVGILEWTPDGSHLVFAKSRLPDPEVELWRIPAEGGEAQRLGLTMDHLRGLRFHPDGRQIVFAAGDTKPEVWVMENLLPKLQASR